MKGQTIIPHGGLADGDVLVMVQLLSGYDADLNHSELATDVLILPSPSLRSSGPLLGFLLYIWP